ncbi:MAG: sugar ABC transporter permease [Bifidobacteriaceae bacterium]|jgi:multiple sugar transport system permease protein|nr:sugar ABC transporter permease [Bifidobacteriaceae bacterium]
MTAAQATPSASPPTATPAGTTRRPRKRKRQLWRDLPAWGFLTPVAVLFVLFMVAPIGYALFLSFRTYKTQGLGLGKGARKEVWNGLENYAKALSDPEFLASVGRVLIYGLVLVPTMILLATIFALLLDSRRARLKQFSRVSIFLPYAVPAVISSLMWGFLYLPAVSPFHWLAGRAGVSLPNMVSPNLITFAVANIALWGGVGFNMVVIYTSLKAIPSELYEAAVLDGCTEFQIAVRVKVPIVAPAIIMTLLFSLISTLQVFAEPMTLKPLTNTVPSTWTPLMKIYRDAFVRDDIFSAAASSIVVAFVTFLVSFGFLRLVQGRAFNEDQ